MTAEQIAAYGAFFKFKLGDRVEVALAVSGASRTYGRVEGRGVEDTLAGGVKKVYQVRLDGYPLHLGVYAEGSLAAVA